ncbi:MAG TPA: hypothetical protein VE989_10250 [Sphingomicrobium sp.]|nr:hypothetical protein [Sphingomicrobium sp.]
MSLKGRWRIVAMPDYVDDYPDMVEPAYIRFDKKGSGEFAFGCVTGDIRTQGEGDALTFRWKGNDEMEEAQGDGWAQLQPDGSLKGQIRFDRGDEADFTARKDTSSTTC